MELIKIVALAFRNDENFNGVWPEPATELTVSDTYSVDFDEEVCQNYTNFAGDLVEYSSDYYEIGDHRLNYDEWDDNETITKEQYNQWLADNPTWYEDMLAARQVNITKIAELNKQVAAIIDQMTDLAEESGVDLTIDLGQHGSLNPNSDWDESRC